MTPTHFPSMQTIRTVVDAHFVVHSIQSELAMGDTVSISMHQARFKVKTSQQ